MGKNILIKFSVIFMMVLFCFGFSRVAKAADFHSLCIQGSDEACEQVRDVQRYYNIQKMLVLFEYIDFKNLIEIPFCDPKFCDPPKDLFWQPVDVEDLVNPVCDPKICDPIFKGHLLIDPIELRSALIDVIENIDMKLEYEEKF